MKRISLKKAPHNHKLLQSQSQKLRDKLDNLKRQIEAKKKQKLQNSNKKMVESSLSHSRKSNDKNQDNQAELSTLLSNLKMEPIAQKLKTKNITTMNQFSNISEQELDTWKDIAVGYRIKIKKFIARNQMFGSSSKKTSKQDIPEQGRYDEVDIEAIVKNRKEVPMQVPIKRADEEVDQPEEIGEEEQQIMIQSLMEAFKGQPKQAPPSGNFQVQGDEVQSQDEQSLQQIVYSKPITSVKTININIKSVWEGQTYPDYKYCWLCLDKINQKNQLSDKSFCSEICMDKYKDFSQIPEQSAFYREISEVEEKFDHFVKARELKQKKNKGPKKPIIRRVAQVKEQEQWQGQEQEIDLNIV